MDPPNTSSGLAEDFERTRENSTKRRSEPLGPRDGSKSARRGLKTPPRALQEASRRLQERSGRPQDGSKSARRGLGALQGAFKPSRVRSKSSASLLEVFGGLFEHPQDGSAQRGLRSCPRRLQARSKACLKCLEPSSSIRKAAQHLSK